MKKVIEVYDSLSIREETEKVRDEYYGRAISELDSLEVAA